MLRKILIIFAFFGICNCSDFETDDRGPSTREANDTPTKKGEDKKGKKKFEVDKINLQKLNGGIDQDFYCYNKKDNSHPGYLLTFSEQNTFTATAKNKNGNILESYKGSYNLNNGMLEIGIPEINFSDKSIGLSPAAFDILLTFETTLLKCHATGHKKGKMVEGSFKCPTIKYIPSVGYEDNKFEFSNRGSVVRRRVKEISGVDTLYRTTYGVYFIQNNQFIMFFGDWIDPPEEKTLTGKIIPDQGFTIDQLEPSKGMCN